jgi:hypothetical protein
LNRSGKSKKYSGYFFLILSCVLYAAALLLPFLGLSAGTSAILFTVFVIVAELSFLAGAFFLGKEIVRKYRSKLNPLNWFKKKNDDSSLYDPGA